jgi:DNA-binding GntR family transcriptional regulator
VSVNLKSLRQQVYEFLKGELNRGALAPGSLLDLNGLAARLGTSRTPLREALLQLDAEGFVTILPRRGVRVNRLTLAEIRHIYEIVGALEGAALLSVAPALTGADLAAMAELCRQMREALASDDFPSYYERNLAFHEVFLGRCDNSRLVEWARLLKERLYDFPRLTGFVKAWEEASVGEHEEIVRRLSAGDARAAADHLRDVHWSYAVQEPYIHRYYDLSRGAAENAG